MSGESVTKRSPVRPLIPTPPDYVLVCHGRGEFGEWAYTSLPLSYFDEPALREIGREWTEALLSRAAEQREEAFRPVLDETALREIGREWTEALLGPAGEQRATGGGS